MARMAMATTNAKRGSPAIRPAIGVQKPVPSRGGHGALSTGPQEVDQRGLRDLPVVFGTPTLANRTMIGAFTARSATLGQAQSAPQTPQRLQSMCATAALHPDEVVRG